MFKQNKLSIILLFIVSTLLIGILTGCLHVAEQPFDADTASDMKNPADATSDTEDESEESIVPIEIPTLSDKEAMAIKQAYYAIHADGNQAEYEAEDISLRFYGRYDDCYVIFVENPIMVFIPCVTYETVAGVEFVYGDSRTMSVYHNGDFFDLQEAYTNGLLTVDDLLMVKEIRSKSGTEDKREEAVVAVELPILSEKMDLQIRQEYYDTYYDRSGTIAAPNSFTLAFWGEYHGCYVVFIEGEGALDVLTRELVGNFEFLYSSSNQLKVYKDGTFYKLKEAFENEVINSEDLSAMYQLFHSNRDGFRDVIDIRKLCVQ